MPYSSRKALPTELWLFIGEVTGRADRVTAVNTVLPESTEIAKLSKSTQTAQDEIFSQKAIITKLLKNKLNGALISEFSLRSIVSVINMIERFYRTPYGIF